MKYFRIFLLHLNDALTDRMRSLVWLLLPLINGGFFMLFWYGAFQGGQHSISGWDQNTIITYYLLLIIAGSLLLSHIEILMDTEIRQGNVVKYFLKPFPYYWFMFFIEVPYRLIQGTYAILFYAMVAVFFPAIRVPVPDSIAALLIISIFTAAFFLTFSYKMLLGLITFWTKDNKGIHDTSDVLVLFFAGFSLPLTLLPGPLSDIALQLPFAYFIYYPIVSLQGQITQWELVRILGMQLFWLAVFHIAYSVTLRRGLKKFTAVGQ